MRNDNDLIGTPEENPSKKSRDPLTPRGFDNPNGSSLDAWDPNDGQYFKGQIDYHDPYDRPDRPGNPGGKSEIVKVDGVEAYSQVSSLYKGRGQLQKFVPQPGLIKEIGKMPAGKFNPEPPRPYVERNKSGFQPMDSYPRAGRVPVISPVVSNVQDSTTAETSHHTSYRDLLKELNRNIGSRNNRYVLELDVPIANSPDISTLNILCQATSFPTKSMSVANVYRFGRKYNLRGEVNYGDSWTLTFVEDSDMSVRKILETWHIDIDDSAIQGTGLSNVYTNPRSRVRSNQTLDNREQGYRDGSWFNNLPESFRPSLPNYQTDIRVYQLDLVGNKVMGYLMQNAFVSEIQAIEYADDFENQLTKVSVTFTYSEFLPLMSGALEGKLGTKMTHPEIGKLW